MAAAPLLPNERTRFHILLLFREGWEGAHANDFGIEKRLVFSVAAAATAAAATAAAATLWWLGNFVKNHTARIM